MTTGRFNQTRHHTILAHGLAVQAIRAADAGHKSRPAENIHLRTGDRSAQQSRRRTKATRDLNRNTSGRHAWKADTPTPIESAGNDAPKFTDEELKIISSPLDFVGINIYTPSLRRATVSLRLRASYPARRSFPHMASPWLTVGPEA